MGHAALLCAQGRKACKLQRRYLCSWVPVFVICISGQGYNCENEPKPRRTRSAAPRGVWARTLPSSDLSHTPVTVIRHRVPYVQEVWGGDKVKCVLSLLDPSYTQSLAGS